MAADSNTFALKPRARIMRTLGNELISNDAVAVIELVKNSYDADATRILVSFYGPLNKGEGGVEVIDNGVGMSISVVRSAWMEPATPNKRGENRHSQKFSRRYLGEKGIGRFATMRLSEELELITLAEGSNQEVYGLFDWRQFDDPDKYLDEVLFLTKEQSPKEISANGSINKLSSPMFITSDDKRSDVNLSSGTILKMKNLKHDWGEDEFTELQRGLARLISPFFDLKKLSIALDVPDEFSQFSGLISPPTIVDYPHYSVKGKVAANGKSELTLTLHAGEIKRPMTGGFVRGKNMRLQYLSDEAFQKHHEDLEKLKQAKSNELSEPNDTDEENLPLDPQCGDIEIELRIWDRDDLGNLEQVSSGSLKDIRKDLDALAGVSIYRDGFRVLPYGEPNNDWLRLDIRRVQKPSVRLSNNQVVGYVAITADGNENLTDQSNRQGLNENLAYQDLKEMMLSILNEIENLRRAARKPPPSPDGDGPGTSKSLFANLDFGEIFAYLESAYPADNKAKDLISGVEKQFSKQLENIKSAVSRYHSLATLGQLIDVLLHDGRQPLSTINSQSLLGKEDIEDIKSSESDTLLEKLYKRFTIIANQGNVLHTAFRRVEPFGGRKKGRPAQLYLEKIIDDAFEVFSTQLTSAGIVVELPKTTTLVKIDPAEFQEVLINLLQNSIYWLQFVAKEDRKIAVTVKRTAEDCVEIIFADSGPGVPPESKKAIFDPYFSTKPDGIGLGLSIVGEIITDYYGGSLELLDDSTIGGAAFRMTLRKRV